MVRRHPGPPHAPSCEPPAHLHPAPLPQLAEAVEAEKYDEAAGLRDRLRQLEEAAAAAADAASQYLCPVDEPRFALGEMVVHSSKGYRGVICGWDMTCCEGSEWQEAAGVRWAGAGRLPAASAAAAGWRAGMGECRRHAVHASWARTCLPGCQNWASHPQYTPEPPQPGPPPPPQPAAPGRRPGVLPRAGGRARLAAAGRPAAGGLRG